MNEKPITEEQLRKVLKDACQKVGSQKAWAKENKFSETYISDLLNGKPLSDKVALKLGYKRMYVYKEKRN